VLEPLEGPNRDGVGVALEGRSSDGHDADTQRSAPERR
jgi:hypothetical protein